MPLTQAQFQTWQSAGVEVVEIDEGVDTPTVISFSALS